MENRRLNLLNSIPVLVLSTGYEPLYKTNWKKAISAVASGRAEVLETKAGVYIGTCSGEIPFPIKVRYLSGVVIGKIKKFYRTPRPTKRNLWLRDKGQCQYCSKKITLSNCTVDHVMPKSKGGKHVWNNIVLSCSTCNQKKGSRLLEDTSMSLKSQPRCPAGPEAINLIISKFCANSFTSV